MVRRKLAMVKIERLPNRQVTFSKRRNGLLKKCYELSILCDVDVVIIIFSESGKLTIFSGKRSLEDIFARFLSIPENERGRIQDIEVHIPKLFKTSVESLKFEKRLFYQTRSAESQVKDLEQEYQSLQLQLEEVNKKLSVYEDHIYPTSLNEAINNMKVMEDTLNRIRQRKQVLEEKYIIQNMHQSVQVYFPPNGSENLVNNAIHNIRSLQPSYLQTQSEIFIDSNGFLRIRNQTQSSAELLQIPPNLNHENEKNGVAYMNQSNGMVNGNELPHPEFGYANANNSFKYWNEQISFGNYQSPFEDPTEQAISRLFLSQVKR